MLDHLPYQDAWKVSTLLGEVVYGLLFFAIATAIAALIRITTSKLSHRHHHYWKDWTAILFLSQLAQVGVYILCFILYAHLIPSLHALAAALLTGASVLTLVIGLGSQNILGNVAAGISVLMYRPFRMGDIITVSAPTGYETGRVEKISLSHTILRMTDGRRVNVPNGVIVNQSTIVDDRPPGTIKPPPETKPDHG